MPKLSTGLMLLSTACGGAAMDRPDGQNALTPGVSIPAQPTPTRTAAELEVAGAVPVSGVVDCIGGDWSVYAWRLRPQSQRDVRGLPTHPPEVGVLVGSPGAYEVPVPMGPRRLVAAIESSTGIIAWSDVEGRGLPVHGALARLDLRCELTPTPVGSESVPQGEQVYATQTSAPKRSVSPISAIMEDGGPATLSAQLRRGGRHFGGVQTERLIRARYADSLSEEQLRVHMPMLLQLADDQASSDQLVRRARSTPVQL